MPISHLPLELVEHIIWFLVPVKPRNRVHLRDLVSTSLVSRAFHAASIRPLYQVMTPDTTYSETDMPNLPRVLDTLNKNAQLGRTVRALGLHEEMWTPRSEEVLFSLVRACRENLDELSLGNFRLDFIGDLLAQARSLRLLRLHGCEIRGPPTLYGPVPCTTVQHLALDRAEFTTETFPAQLFPSLQTLSFTNPREESVFATLPFLLSLPPTLTALRIHFKESLLEEDDEHEGAPPTQDEWRRALQRLPNLEHLECDHFNMTSLHPSNKFLHHLHPKVELKTFSLYVRSSASTETFWELEMCLQLLVRKWMPPSLGRVQRINVTEIWQWDDRTDVVEEGGSYRDVLRKCCEMKGIQLKIDEEENELSTEWVIPDPFLDELVPKKRWLSRFDPYCFDQF